MERTSDARAVSRSAVVADLGAILLLLAESDLPTGGIDDDSIDGFAVATSPDGQLVGCAASEVHGTSGLLRSVAVASDLRGFGIGRSLVDDRVAWSRARKLKSLYLLTTTAPSYFERLGFERVERASVPAPVSSSAEFTELCPSTAVVMRLRLDS